MVVRSADDVLRSLGSGAATSLTVRTLEAPLERVKLLLQNQNMATAEHRPYSGAINAMVRVSQEQGIASFWRGNLTNCLRVAPTSALRFTLMDHFQAIAVYGLPQRTGSKLPLERQMLSGGLSGATTALFVYPLDLMRTKLSADVGDPKHRRYSGLPDCFRQTLQQHGWRGLYRGLVVSVLEITPYTALTLGGYEYFKRVLPQGDSARFPWWLPLDKLGVGYLAGLTGSLVCYPMDTVKRQLMLDGSVGFRSKYDGSIAQCIHVLYREGGVQAFYRGCLFNAMKSAVSAGLTLVINDAFRSLAGWQARS